MPIENCNRRWQLLAPELLRMDEADERRWQLLAPDLLRMISERISNVSDYIHFRCVCNSWRHAAARRFSPHFPVLMLDHDPHEKKRNVLDILTGKIHSISIPQLVHRVILDSHLGWILLMETVPAEARLFLMNALTGAEIHLPPTDFLKSDVDIYPWNSCMRLSPDMALSDSIVVICISGEVLFYRLSDKSWSKVKVPSGPLFLGSVGLNEGRLYMSDGLGLGLWVCEMDTLNIRSIDVLDREHWGKYNLLMTRDNMLVVFLDLTPPIPEHANVAIEYFNQYFHFYELLGDPPELWLTECLNDNNEMFRSMNYGTAFLVFHRDLAGQKGGCIFYSSTCGIIYKHLKSDSFGTLKELDFETCCYDVDPAFVTSLDQSIWIDLSFFELSKQYKTSSGP